jgi:hypothetical protein
VVVWWCYSVMVVVVWWCGGVVVWWCGGVVVWWCGGVVVWWGGGVVVVWWWCGGGVVVVWWWCGGGVVMCGGAVWAVVCSDMVKGRGLRCLKRKYLQTYRNALLRNKKKSLQLQRRKKIGKDIFYLIEKVYSCGNTLKEMLSHNCWQSLGVEKGCSRP